MLLSLPATQVNDRSHVTMQASLGNSPKLPQELLGNPDFALSSRHTAALKPISTLIREQVARSFVRACKPSTS
jgi:hypothetical protein